MGTTLTLALLISAGHAEEADILADDAIAAQRATLTTVMQGEGFGPQSPRDIEAVDGRNRVVFNPAPPYRQMTLCNIHFHESAEHKGGEFTTYAGNGDSTGYGTGYVYDGTLSEAERAPFEIGIGDVGHGDLQPGDTIEVHYVYSTARVEPGATLGACLDEAIANPQLRVEAQVYVLVNDSSAADFRQLAKVEPSDDYFQAVNMPDDLGTPVQYPGSTTGPAYNLTGSPFQVTWSVWPNVLKVDIGSLAAWLEDNRFEEKHAHGVRNLVVNPDLLAPMGE